MFLQRHGLVLAGLLIIALGSIVAPVMAANHTLNPGDSIQTAINSAGSGDTIILNPGTYTEYDITIARNITVRANTSAGGSAADTIIDGMSTDRIFNITPGGYSLTIDNLTLRNGYTSGDGGAIYANGGTVTITTSSIFNCSAGVYGGAIFSDGGSTVTITTSFSNCSSLGGGAIFSRGGGIVTITTSTFSTCSSQGPGGAIFSDGDSTVTSSTITNCSSLGDGGAIFYESGTLTITSSAITNCSAPFSTGGAIHAFRGSVIITTSTITDCSAIYGGAMYAESGTVTITSSTIRDCSASHGGGAVYTYGSSSVTLHFSRIFHDTGSAVENNGGAIDAANNWWGSNADPSGYTSGGVTVSPWLVLTITATPSTITTAQNAIIRTNLTETSAGTDTTSGGIFVTDGIPVAFALTSGTGSLAPLAGTISSGANTTTLTSAGAGSSTVSVTVDNQTVSADIFVTVPTAARPVADFSADVLHGPAPLTVRFTDASTNTPAGWAWFFGDETYSQPWTLANASAGWEAREYHSSVAQPDGSMVLMGGYLLHGMMNDTWQSRDNGLTWSLVNASSGWGARGGHSSVAMPDGSIVLLGGYEGDSNVKNDTWRSTDNGATWTLVNASSGWSPRFYHSSVAMPDGSIVLTGGYCYGSCNGDVWRSKDMGATWTLMNASAGWSGRYDHSSVVMPDGSIVLTGGNGISCMNDTWRSDDSGATWTRLNASAGWSARIGHSSGVMPDGSIVLIGGADDNGLLNDTWRSTDNGATWTQVNAAAGWPARSGQRSVITSDSSIVLTGGVSSSLPFTYEHDVWRFQPAGSSEQNPSHTYTLPGNYTVALQVYNDEGSNSTLETGYITVTDAGFKVTTISVDPPGDLISGTPVNVSYTVDFPGTDGETFPSTSELQMSTDLDNPRWNYTLILDGVESPQPASGGQTLSISGWVLSYPATLNESLRGTLEGTAPYVSSPASRMIVNVTEFDSYNNPLMSTRFSRTALISPSDAPLVADFSGVPTAGAAPLIVAFTDESTGYPTGRAWYFGDEDFSEPWTLVNASSGWSGRYDHTSVAMPDGSIVLMGGVTGSGIGHNDTWRSTDNGATWVLMNASCGWSATDTHRSVAMPDGSIVLAGGFYHDAWRSMDNGATWVLMNASTGWEPRGDFSLVVVPDGSIVLMGGIDSTTNPINDVWRSVDYGATWTQLPDAGWSFRYGHTSVGMPDGSIIVMGGWSWGYLNDVWRSADNGASWTLMNASSGWSPRTDAASVAMPDGSILLMGGDSDTIKRDVWRSEDYGATWTQLTAAAGWSRRYDHASVAMADGSIVLTGGWLPGSNANDTWRFQPAGSTEQDPSHTYTTPGTYTVTLQVCNTFGCNSTQKKGYITGTSGAMDMMGVFRPSTHTFILKNGTERTVVPWGLINDTPVSGDWNGNGITDVGVYRPLIQKFILKNGTEKMVAGWGRGTDTPVVGDWNGDGLWDVGVYRPSIQKFILKNGTERTVVPWGLINDTPVSGDWDGDGLWDVGVYRPSIQKFILKNGSERTVVPWGLGTDIPVSGDWNGDGMDDVGVYRPSIQKFILKNGSERTVVLWGRETDIPVTGNWR